MIQGIHHITAIASNAQQTIHFYTGILGLRLVKKTVNQDDVSTYHLFFGDRRGHPGMDLTFFVFLPSFPGRTGSGLVTTVSFQISDDALSFWELRLQSKHIPFQKIVRFTTTRLLFSDPDGLPLELVAVNETPDESLVWETPEIHKTHAISQFYEATLSVMSLRTIDPILTHLFGYKKNMSDKLHHLYTLPNGKRASRLTLIENPDTNIGQSGAGTVHHIAFRAKNSQEQLTMSNIVRELGLSPTDVINRFYFQSVYFRTPAGILFEIATDGPGFLADEQESELGKHLALPPFLEPQRKDIEANLPVIG